MEGRAHAVFEGVHREEGGPEGYCERREKLITRGGRYGRKGLGAKAGSGESWREQKGGSAGRSEVVKDRDRREWWRKG